MPVRNSERWLRDAVVSVLRQEFRDFELVIVDDGSDADTVDLLETFARADGRVRVIRQPAQGLVATLNRGIAEARAPYLARLDADDRARPDRLGGQLAFMQDHAEIGLLGTFAETIDSAGAVVGHRSPPTDGVRLVRYLSRGNPFIHSSVMMRAGLVRELGGYRAAFRAAEDYDLWLRMAEACGIAILPEYLVQYRRHRSNLSRLDAVRQSFSVRLAQRSAGGRRCGGGDPAAGLAAPPDWWAEGAANSFFGAEADFYRFLDSGPRCGQDYLSAVEARLFTLNHVERKLAQMRLQALLNEIGRPIGRRHARIVTLMAVLHPTRAFSMLWRRRAA
jgi:glycosyltransferase involved in cell wall biosynthesis